MTKKQKIHNVRSVYREVSGKDMKEDDANYIYQSLSSFRKVKDVFADNENNILKDAFSLICESNYAYYPLDVIELRLFLTSNRISCMIDTLFSYKFIRKYCHDYPLMLCIDISKTDMERYGGIVMDDDSVDLTCSLRRLYISPKLNKITIGNILCTVKELCPKVDIVIDVQVPGVLKTKLV